MWHQYCLRSLIHATPTNGTKRFQAKSICEKAGIPEPYTRKVFQSLVSGGFLEAARGPGGGYQLTENPRDITLLGVIRAVDGEAAFGECILGLAECGEANPCPLHEVWAKAKGDLLAQLDQTTLGHLIEVQQERG